MGRSYRYDCPRCGYQAIVCGGIDEGQVRIIQTIECRDCRELYDVVIRLRETGGSALAQQGKWGTKPATTIAGSGDPELGALMSDKLLPVGLNQIKWTMMKPACPVSRLHRIKLWNEPGKCPRCGVFVERTILPFRVWD